MVAYMVERGELTQEQAKLHPGKNVITRAVGTEPEVEGDVLPYFDFDLDKVTAFARRRNPDLEIFPISAKTGEGVEALADWLCTRIRTHKEKKKETNA